MTLQKRGLGGNYEEGLIKVRTIQIPATLKRVGQMIVRCLGCGVAWVVSGLRPGDTHICKECGRRSVIERRATGAIPLSRTAVNS